MEYILTAVTAFVCALSFLLMLRDMKTHGESYIAVENRKETPVSKSPSFVVYCSVMIVLTLAVSVLFCTLYKDNGLLMNVKRMTLLALLWPIAYIDLKSYRIPNAFVVFGLICRVVIFAFELVFNSEYVFTVLLMEAIAVAALLLTSLLCALCIKNSIGFGDIKLFVVMGLMLGLDGIWGAIFLSLIVSFIICIVLLITKKKSRKDAIPFGPALVIGTYLSVILTGM